MNDSISIINLNKYGDKSIGYLSFFEELKEIPFEIRRVYYTYGVPVETKRGMHAHKKLKQLLWCPYGEIEFIFDDGNNKKTILLNSPEKAIILNKGIWRDMYWKKEDSVLCVAASDYYREDDYIRDYFEFLRYVKEGYWNNENKL